MTITMQADIPDLYKKATDPKTALVLTQNRVIFGLQAEMRQLRKDGREEESEFVGNLLKSLKVDV